MKRPFTVSGILSGLLFPGCIAMSMALSVALPMAQSGCTGAASGTAGSIEISADPMNTTDPTTSARRIPAIDAEAPATFETATFALG